MSDTKTPDGGTLTKWKPLEDVVADVRKVLEEDWEWTSNVRCKYVGIRVDMRDGKAILLDRNYVHLPLKDLQRQGCGSCGEYGAPSHNGSKSCESGSIASGGNKSHCTCDTCF